MINPRLLRLPPVFFRPFIDLVLTFKFMIRYKLTVMSGDVRIITHFWHIEIQSMQHQSFLDTLSLSYISNVYFTMIHIILFWSLDSRFFAFLNTSYNQFRNFHLKEKACWNFGWYCIESIDKSGKNWHLKTIESSDPWSQGSSPFIWIFIILYIALQFSV